MLFPNTQKQRDPFPRDQMVPGRVRPIGPNGAQANGFGTAGFGKLGGNPKLLRSTKQVANDAGPVKHPFGHQIRPPQANIMPVHPGGRGPGWETPPNGQPGGNMHHGPGPIDPGYQPPTQPPPGNGGGQIDPTIPPPPHTVPNPNDFLGGSVADDPRDPLQHQRYWANQGWSYQGENPGHPGGQFVHNQNALSDYLAQNSPIGLGSHGGAGGGIKNGGQGGGGVGAHGGQGMGGGRPNPNDHLPGGNNPPGGNGGGNGSGTGPPDPTAEEGLFDAQGMLNPGAINALRKQYGLPLDAQFENQRANLVQQLNTAMAGILSGRGTAQGQYGLDKARLDTQQGLDNRSLINSMAGQGVYGSGIQNHNQTLLDTQYGRQNQDMGLGLTNQLGGLDLQQQQLQSGFTGSLSDLFADLIRRNAKTGGNAPKGKG